MSIPTNSTLHTTDETMEAMAQEVEKMAAIAQQELGQTSHARILTNMAYRLRTNRFTVLVIGEFSAGKSTVLNAMLGQDLLPRQNLESSAVITEIEYGEQPQARVYFYHNADGSVAIAPELQDEPDPELLQDAPQNGQLYDADRAASSLPSEIEESKGEREADEIWGHLASPATGDMKTFKRKYTLTVDDSALGRTSNRDRFSHVSHVVIAYAIDLCKHQVRLVDSPGLGAHQVRAQRARRYWSKADAIIFVLGPTGVSGEQERHILENVLPKRRGNIFFLINKWDTIGEQVLSEEEKEAEQEKAKTVIYRDLRPYCVSEDGRDLTHQRIFFVSALQALGARTNSARAHQLEESNMPAFEATLQRYLIAERIGAAKQALYNESQELFRQLEAYIKGQIISARIPLPKLEAQIQEVEPKLEQMANLRDFIINFLHATSNNLQEAVIRSYRAEIERMIEAIPDEVAKFDFQPILQDNLLRSVLAQQLTDWIRTQFHLREENTIAAKYKRTIEPQIMMMFERHFGSWSNTDLQNLLRAINVDVEKYLRSEVAQYIQLLRQVEEITGRPPSDGDVDKLLLRWLDSIQHPTFRPHDGGEVGGAVGDLSWLIGSIGVDVAAEIFLHTSVLWVPVVGFVISAFRVWLRERKARGRLQTSTIKGLQEGLRNVEQQAIAEASIRDDIAQQYKALETAIDQSITAELDILRASLSDAVRIREDTEFSAVQLESKMNNARQELHNALARIEILSHS